jgi:glycosyltransferase involved in cell wall biosynthesis
MNRPLHVMVDALGSYSGGARTSMRYLVPKLLARGDVTLSVVCRRDQVEGFSLPLDSVHWLEVPHQVRALPARLAWSASVVPVWAAQHKADVLFCPTDQAPPKAPCAVTMMIRNPTPYVKDPDRHVTPARRVREMAMRAVTLASAWRSQRIILVSQAALDATAAVIPLPMNRVRVVHHGRDDRFSPPPAGQVRETQRILSVSSIYTFKNYPVLLDAMAVLRDQHGHRPKLDIAGAFFDEAHAALLQSKVKALNLADQVTFLGEVPHPKLVERYRQCTFFVMPSRLETFGHPYIEAMATGTAALLGDIPCAREMCGDAVWYADVNAPSEFAARMATLLTDTAQRQRLERAGPPRAQQFSWQHCAEETVNVWKESVAAPKTP